LSVSDDADLAPGYSTAEHVNEIGRKAGRGLTWSLLGIFGGVSLVPTLPALERPTIGAVVSGSSFLQLSLAGGAGLIVYILVVVPLNEVRKLKTLWAPFR
jgi:membrane protease YdiL (CAAX protease family)